MVSKQILLFLLVLVLLNIQSCFDMLLKKPSGYWCMEKLSSKDLSSSSCYTSPSNISNINLLTTYSLLRELQTIQPYLSPWEGYGLANAGYYFQAHEGQENHQE